MNRFPAMGNSTTGLKLSQDNFSPVNSRNIVKNIKLRDVPLMMCILGTRFPLLREILPPENNGTRNRNR